MVCPAIPYRVLVLVKVWQKWTHGHCAFTLSSGRGTGWASQHTRQHCCTFALISCCGLKLTNYFKDCTPSASIASRLSRKPKDVVRLIYTHYKVQLNSCIYSPHAHTIKQIKYTLARDLLGIHVSCYITGILCAVDGRLLSLTTMYRHNNYRCIILLLLCMESYSDGLLNFYGCTNFFIKQYAAKFCIILCCSFVIIIT